MSDSDTYQYHPLSSANEIRLLLLQPEAPGSDIHCRLIHTTLKECHDDIYENYTALSYAWGDASQTRVIFIDKRPFEITINLAAALDDLRHQHTILRLWADAICIDQSNISERNHQVGLMRDIYSYAQHTVIHFGDSNDDCDQVMNAALQGPLSSHLQRLLALQILSRPWFTRVWIFQELVLSKDPWIQCGRKRIRSDVLHGSLRKGRDFQRLSWSDIPGNEEEDRERMEVTHAIEPIESEEEEDEKSQNSSETWSRSRMLVTDVIELKKRSWRREENSDYWARLNESALIERFYDMNAARRSYTTLFTVVLGRRGSRATDLRDLVYGYLAVDRLPPKRNYPPCPAEYRKSVVDVFTEATTYMLEKDRTYEVLQQIDVCNPSIRLKGLPSWVHTRSV
ncbi:HET-domain-containing protein [Hyaloscypha hepaticicola]|uniref:HET-domain-containing protein n=1 Tax=Hyaloscypha hepaticicola TaxID=2082293 RepID=A0A2J6PS37_9HELO|nr:HET-domain-containing protein [Hyaloscypha hepaticicola]